MNKSDFVKNMFDKLSADYDFMNNIITFGLHKNIKRKSVNNAGIKPGDKILDVCTGTGDISIITSKEFGASIEITAVDFSEKMLEIAQKRAKKYKNINFLQADALNLPFADSSFDVVFISFGLRNLVDINSGILELKRVIKDNGVLVNIDMGKPRHIFGLLLKLYMSLIVPLLGNFFHKDAIPYKYLFNSSQDFPDQDELEEIYLKAGFKNVKKYNFLFGAIAQQIAVK